jgi:5,10-methylenetetrahydromethanopterin reductase
MGRDAFLILAALANVTDSVALGTGLINGYSRTPAAIAQATVGLSEWAPGREINIAIGASTKALVEWFHGHCHVSEHR